MRLAVRQLFLRLIYELLAKCVSLFCNVLRALWSQTVLGCLLKAALLISTFFIYQSRLCIMPHALKVSSHVFVCLHYSVTGTMVGMCCELLHSHAREV